MATTTRTKAAPVESAQQDSVPLPANTGEDSVPEVEAAMSAGEPENVADKPLQSWIVWRDAQHFEIRTFTLQDWEKAGVQNGRTLHWHARNNFRVKLEEVSAFLSEDQIQQFILSERRFEIVEE